MDATRAREHLSALSRHRKGRIGHRRAAQLSGLSFRRLQAVRRGTVTQIRATTEARILAIPLQPAPGLLINSYDARHLIAVLVEEGFTLAQLAKYLRFDLAWMERYAQPVALAPRFISSWRAARIRRFFARITAEGPDLPDSAASSWSESVESEARRLEGARTRWGRVEASRLASG